MKKSSKIYVVSKIEKINIKGDTTKYLVKWHKSSVKTWEPLSNFTNKLESYPGYQKAVYHLFRVRNKYEKNAIEIMIKNFNIN